MDLITHAQLRGLVETGIAPCISIYLPTHTGSRDLRQDPIELKNRLQEAEQRLVDRGMRGTEARDLLEPARRLLDDGDFWAANTTGLAIFLCPNFFRVYRLPVGVEANLTVNERFEVKPLLPLLEGKLFYILAVSRNDARLLECTPTSCRFIPLPEDVALSVKDSVHGEDEHQTDTMKHSVDTSNPFSAGGAFHGQGTEIGKSEQADFDFFLRQLDDGVRRAIREDDAPLVLAGADSTTPYYRLQSKHKHLVPKSIDGNHEHTANEMLHQHGLELMEPIWHEKLNAMQERFGTALAQQKASASVRDVVTAALEGRVDTLFVSPNLTKWGQVDEVAHSVAVHDREKELDIDLIDEAAVRTLLTSGTVVVCAPEEIPGNGELAAIYRY